MVLDQPQQGISLPPEVQGEKWGELLFSIERIHWIPDINESLNEHPDVDICFQWWGERGQGSILRPVVVQGEEPIFDADSNRHNTTTVFDIRSSPEHFKAYLNDVGIVELEILERRTQTPVGRTGLAADTISFNKPMKGWLTVYSFEEPPKPIAEINIYVFLKMENVDLTQAQSPPRSHSIMSNSSPGSPPISTTTRPTQTPPSKQRSGSLKNSTESSRASVSSNSILSSQHNSHGKNSKQASPDLNSHLNSNKMSIFTSGNPFDKPKQNTQQNSDQLSHSFENSLPKNSQHAVKEPSSNPSNVNYPGYAVPSTANLYHPQIPQAFPVLPQTHPKFQVPVQSQFGYQMPSQFQSYSQSQPPSQTYPQSNPTNDFDNDILNKVIERGKNLDKEMEQSLREAYQSPKISPPKIFPKANGNNIYEKNNSFDSTPQLQPKEQKENEFASTTKSEFSSLSSFSFTLSPESSPQKDENVFKNDNLNSKQQNNNKEKSHIVKFQISHIEFAQFDPRLLMLKYRVASQPKPISIKPKRKNHHNVIFNHQKEFNLANLDERITFLLKQRSKDSTQFKTIRQCGLNLSAILGSRNKAHLGIKMRKKGTQADDKSPKLILNIETLPNPQETRQVVANQNQTNNTTKQPSEPSTPKNEKTNSISHHQIQTSPSNNQLPEYELIPTIDQFRLYINIMNVEHDVKSPLGMNDVKPNLFIKCRLPSNMCQENNFSTSVFFGSNSPSFNFHKVTQFLPNCNFLSRISKKSFVVELWNQISSGQYEFLGLCQCSLSAFSKAFNFVTGTEEKKYYFTKHNNNYPVECANNVFEIRNPINSRHVANINLIAAIGLPRQIVYLRTFQRCAIRIQRVWREYKSSMQHNFNQKEEEIECKMFQEAQLETKNEYTEQKNEEQQITPQRLSFREEDEKDSVFNNAAPYSEPEREDQAVNTSLVQNQSPDSVNHQKESDNSPKIPTSITLAALQDRISNIIYPNKTESKEDQSSVCQTEPIDNVQTESSIVNTLHFEIESGRNMQSILTTSKEGTNTLQTFITSELEIINQEDTRNRFIFLSQSETKQGLISPQWNYQYDYNLLEGSSIPANLVVRIYQDTGEVDSNPHIGTCCIPLSPLKYFEYISGWYFVTSVNGSITGQIKVFVKPQESLVNHSSPIHRLLTSPHISSEIDHDDVNTLRHRLFSNLEDLSKYNEKFLSKSNTVNKVSNSQRQTQMKNERYDNNSIKENSERIQNDRQYNQPHEELQIHRENNMRDSKQSSISFDLSPRESCELSVSWTLADLSGVQSSSSWDRLSSSSWDSPHYNNNNEAEHVNRTT
eukprot:gb/GECH01004079.1/.p1 GENE.gb/GECH01004079.1/~~gb/GECH01004079.1/.p1  ORF type:complete len:1315 (+),score=290.06 gb/GECH01004079.1/:1-3945(+)